MCVFVCVSVRACLYVYVYVCVCMCVSVCVAKITYIAMERNAVMTVVHENLMD